ncbi:MAG TPA: phosphate ABC transporter permease subunit PstC, partial [Psychrobacter sp.]|nr:phosphate ABC transporter permease subunit PstC [Psychrobacter sp.]
ASSEMHVSTLLHLGLILFVITFFVLSISKVMLSRIDKKAGN